LGLEGDASSSSSNTKAIAIIAMMLPFKRLSGRLIVSVHPNAGHFAQNFARRNPGTTRAPP